MTHPETPPRGGGPATSRFHVVLPTRSTAAPELPAFVADVRPALTDPAGRTAVAADLAGLAGALVPFDPGGQESLTVAANALRRTRHLRVVAGFHAAAATPSTWPSSRPRCSASPPAGWAGGSRWTSTRTRPGRRATS
ncbi:hypothetical protein ACFQYP_12555 [Nonomuraea antimicrobica]